MHNQWEYLLYAISTRGSMGGRDQKAGIVFKAHYQSAGIVSKRTNKGGHAGRPAAKPVWTSMAQTLSLLPQHMC